MQKKQKTATYRSPIIGKEIKVIRSNNQTLKGVIGTVTDETRNTITIDTGDKKKKIIKSAVTIYVDGNEINPEAISGRAEERIKK